LKYHGYEGHRKIQGGGSSKNCFRQSYDISNAIKPSFQSTILMISAAGKSKKVAIIACKKDDCYLKFNY